MQLKDHLHIGSPLIWVHSDEPRRVTEEVVLHARRPVFRMDVFDGLMEWAPERKRWTKVLVDFGDSLMPTGDMSVAIKEVIDRCGVMVIENAHLTAEMLVGLYGAIAQQYVNAVLEDDMRELPACFVLVSCKDDIPIEIARDTVKIKLPLPDEKALAGLLDRLKEHGATLYAEERAAVVRAALGMSEAEFVKAASLSLKRKRRVDAEFVNEIKLHNIKSTGLLEIRQPEIGLHDIGGLDLAKELINKVSWIWHNPDRAAELGIIPVRRVLMIGVPGTGKSAICEATANTLKLELAKTGVGHALNKYVGESEANMRRIWEQVHAMKPLCLWIDELGRDLSGSASSSSVDGGTTDRVHGEFLTGLQELPPEVFLMCAANRIDGLPPEMLRADRFDKVLFVGFPAEEEREEIFRIHLGKVANEYDLPALAHQTRLFTGAEIKALIREVNFHVGASQHRIPTTREMLAFIPHLKNRVWMNHHSAVVEMYRRAKVEWDWASSAQREEADEIISGKATASAQSIPSSAELFQKALK